MLNVKNQLKNESFTYQFGGMLRNRLDDILNLEEIFEYCQEIHENMYYSSESWFSLEVEENMNLADWLYSWDASGYDDIRALFLRLCGNFCEESQTDFDESIQISLGEMKNCAHDEHTYADVRRDILSRIEEPIEYGEFMPTCFLNCKFSENINKTLRKIPKFHLYTKEITFNLSILNDKALQIYYECEKDSKDAMAKLSTMARECTGDPKHRKYLKFPFTYKHKENGEDKEFIKEIVCEPHLKLIHRGSDLRIYFYWYDEDIDGGEKVLVGRIGSHPY